MSDQDPGSSRSPLDVNKLPRGAISIRGVPVGRNARLPSIRTPRDLTLAGTQKRTFVPNIPVRRDKKSSNSQNSEQKSPKIEQKHRPSPNTRGNVRGRGRGQREYVQLPGAVFGQGVTTKPKASQRGDKEVKPNRPVVPRASRNQNSFPAAETIVKKEPKSEICYSSGGEEADEGDDFDYNPEGDDSDYEPPVCLPLKMDPELKIKIEKGSKAGWNVEFIKHCNKVAEEGSPENLQDILFGVDGGNYEDQLMFFEFPDTILFPLRSREFNDDSQQRSTPGPSNENSSNNRAASEEPSWAQSVDGYIGKLQLLRSGKTRLVIGDYILDDIEMCDPSPVLQQLVSIQKNPNLVDMSILGQIKHKVRFLADVKSLANIS